MPQKNLEFSLKDLEWIHRGLMQGYLNVTCPSKYTEIIYNI